jgi:hypothetical protein
MDPQRQLALHLIGIDQAIDALHGLSISLPAVIDDDGQLNPDDVAGLLRCVHEKLERHRQGLSGLL